MFSMSRNGFLPSIFGKLDGKYGTPKNAIIFCIAVSLTGPVLGREALGWFVDMSAIGASIGYFFTTAATFVTLKGSNSGNGTLKALSFLGILFSMIFMLLQLVPIPGLPGVCFKKESYIMLFIWIAIGLCFYFKQKSHFMSKS